MDRNDAAIGAARHSAGTDVDAAVPYFPATLKRRCRVLPVRAGQVFFGRRDQEKHVLRLLRGDVSVQREVMGKEITLQRAAPGDWLIDPCAPPSNAYAVGERPSTLLAVPESALVESLDREPGFARAWFREQEMQAARRQRRVERLSIHYSNQRVAHYLATESAGDCGEITLPYPKYVWAAHLGIAAETLSRTLTEMIAAGELEELPGRRYRLLRIV